jgi:hypothetical protein
MVNALIVLLVAVLVVGLVAYLIIMLVDMLPIEGQFKQVARVLIMVIAVLVILSRALPLLGVPVM